MIDKEKLRPAFERWYVDYNRNKDGWTTFMQRDSIGGYLNDHQQFAWLGFCAAFESLGEPVATMLTFPKRGHVHAHPGGPDKTDRELQDESGAVLTELYKLPDTQS